MNRESLTRFIRAVDVKDQDAVNHLMSKEDVNVQIKFEPYREIVILQMNRFDSPEELARFVSIAAGGKASGLYWAEGVAFLYFVIPPTTNVAAKALIEEGRVYWSLVSYAHMPKFQPIIETKEKIMVPLIDVSSDPIMNRAARWLKEEG
ncbi:MAG: hypothetical protein RMJ07_01410 [Nitrososphaerota archaeon]|nr:hypothetical protein [Candidatus Bathyarchaeota archaeon]MDW8048329.1 hypothetical protein [Nitrososphaerota archaeon]